MTETITLTIDTTRPRMTSNDQRRAHWAKVRNEKAAMETEVWLAARRARLTPITTPVRVKIVWHPPNGIHRDSDSLGPFLKAALDSLVKAGILPDDNSRHVLSTTTAIGAPDRDHPRIDIQITPEGNPA